MRCSYGSCRLWRFRFVVGFLFFGFRCFGLFFVGLSGGFLADFDSQVGLFFFGFFCFVEESFLFFLERGAIGDVALAVEQDAAIDQRFLHDRVSAQRVVIVNDQVGVFADVDRTNAVVDAELDRGVQRDEFERFVVREAAVLDGLGRFLIQVRGFFGVVGVMETTTPRRVMMAALYGMAS